MNTNINYYIYHFDVLQPSMLIINCYLCQCGGYATKTVCLSVCLFVSLSVCSLMQKVVHGFTSNFY